MKLKVRKNIDKIIKIALVFSVISMFYTGMLNSVYAVAYKNKPVGYIQKSPEQEIKKIEDKANKMTAEDFSVANEIEIIPTYSFAPTEDNVTAKSLIEADSENNKGYGLKYENKYFYWGKNEDNVILKLEELKSYLNKFYSEDQVGFIENIKLDICFYKTEPEEDLAGIVSKIGLNLKRSEIYKETEIIPHNTVYVYGLEDKIRIQGTDAVKECLREKVYKDNNLISDNLLEETIIYEGRTAVIETSDKSKIIYNYDASVLCLPEYQTSFINKILPTALEGQSEYHIPVSLTLSQAIIESNWGINHIQNNLYGFKAYSGWGGKSVQTQTTEFINGESISVTCYFKGYDSFEDSVKDYLELVGRGDYYSKVRTATNYIEASQYMGESQYATSPTYGETLLNTINTYGLYIWDNI